MPCRTQADFQTIRLVEKAFTKNGRLSCKTMAIGICLCDRLGEFRCAIQHANKIEMSAHNTTENQMF